MSKKAPRRRTAKPAKAAKTPFLKSVLRGFLGFFKEDLPVSEFRGSGKFETEVQAVAQHQAALETICGGRTTKAQKHTTTALLVPSPHEEVTRVEIARKLVGRLKPADVKLLQRHLAKAAIGPCAVKVPALIEGGRRKKNGETEDFTVRLSLPAKPQRKAPSTPDADD